MGLADDVYRAVYDLIKESYGEDERAVGENSPAHFSIQLERSAKWFVRLDLNNPQQQYIVVRLSPDKALAQGAAAEPCAAGPNTCRINFISIDDLQPLKPIILAAYHAVSIATGYLDPSELPNDPIVPPQNP